VDSSVLGKESIEEPCEHSNLRYGSHNVWAVFFFFEKVREDQLCPVQLVTIYLLN